MWNLLLPVDCPDLVDGIDGRRKPSMHAKHPVFNNRRQADVIEYIRAIPPNVDGSVLSQAFIVKPVHL
jgi:hypothetical protein